YMDEVKSSIRGVKEEVDLEELAAALEEKSQDLMKRIREKEWVRDSEGDGWYNGYYDDNGNAVEGEFDTPDGKNVRMMLTGQVFSVMSGTARDEDVPSIIKSVDKHLYNRKIGGYRLNTDFKAVRTDLGRMFGFSYGDKENGAVFSHMAVMYGNALYKRGYAKEGFKALSSLYETAKDFETSRIYPGIPEYFNGEGRGLYNYLTGAASWYLMTVVTEEFGVCGLAGDLSIDPKLVLSQFDDENKASISLIFRGKNLTVTYNNPDRLDAGSYHVKSVSIDGKELETSGEGFMVIGSDIIDGLSDGSHNINVVLG
ncbi:MAG: cellobiose phosphorylase, partial [Butyrivibrio sp.]|nr:cellobiose phosphorylase [Butyrivibrio sp.]